MITNFFTAFLRLLRYELNFLRSEVPMVFVKGDVFWVLTLYSLVYFLYRCTVHLDNVKIHFTNRCTFP